MIRPLSIFLLLICSGSFLPAQKYTQIAKVHYAYFTHKQLFMAGYDVAVHRMNFSICGGVGNGNDDQFLSPEEIENPQAKEDIRSSQTVFPFPFPRNSYLESCMTSYKIQQLRLGFTVFIRKNDTLSRRPATGPHFGVEAVFSNTIESQTLTYKSDVSEMRTVYSGVNHFKEIGAATHMGWQFSLINGHLYLDLRAVLPFYYPFMEEPNLNSPFAGNKWEMQGSIGWRFFKNKDAKNPDGDTDKVRHKI